MDNQTHIKKALQRPYDLNIFTKEVLSPVFGSHFKMSISPVPASILPTQTESQVMGKVLIYGKLELEDGTEIICYEITLQPKVKIEQSKIAIQRYARKLLIAGQGALVNFVSPSNKNIWRLTYIANDTVLIDTKIKDKLTNAKRYTYLLGTYESCKTAAERLEMLSNEPSLSMETLAKAFSVEKLSKSFFDDYLLHYNRFVDYLSQSNFRVSVFNADDKAIRDFSKKLLGRIVFLYFVQKKGWLGASDIEYTDGLHNFMPQFFELSGANDAFYDRYLKILFFETLNKQRENDNFTMPDGKILKIPYLNGGLFDKEEFDEKILTFKADLFHNVLFEDDPKNRGFLDFLNAYNFTIYEDSPDERTVAVDPEMLGHIFENLLEDNKDKGAYYTPKEIVHYMCQESLSEYLKTNLEKNFPSFNNLESLEQLVKQKEISTLTKEQLQTIDDQLDTVKICDPAIGSGAFPMGLLQEIFAIKEVIAYETGTEWKPAEVKEKIIQNSIYGVDIEKGAVDIARLRFWLSLVVDEEKPKALPNLDYKIVVGNSLLSKFEDEIVEIDWKMLNNPALKQSRPDLFKRINENTKNIHISQSDYFHSLADKNKQKLKIRNLKIELLETLIEIEKQILKEKGINAQNAVKKQDLVAITERKIKFERFNRMLDNLKVLKTHTDKPLNYFDWQLDFPEVFNFVKVQNFDKVENSEVENTNAQIAILNKQIDAINQYLKQQNIDTHIINLQTNIVQSQITLIKELLQKIEQTISTIYGELFKVENTIVREPSLSFTFKIKSINAGIDEINKKVTILNPQINSEKTSGSIGFDIVIGNPPYGANLNDDKNILKQKYEFVHLRTIDSFNFFIALSSNLLKNKGTNFYIIPSAYLFQNEFSKSRKFLMIENSFLQALNLGENIFDAVVPSCIIGYCKGKSYSESVFASNLNRIDLLKVKENGFTIKYSELQNLTDFIIPFDVKKYNISDKIFKTNVALLNEFCDEVNSGITSGDYEIFNVSNEQIKKYNLEKDFLKPTLRGRELNKYSLNFQNNFVIYTDIDFKQENAPNIMKYLLMYKEKLNKRSEVKQGIKEWHKLGRARGLNLLKSPKIIGRETGDKIICTLDLDNLYVMNTLICIQLKNKSLDFHKFILCLLNSNLFSFIMKQISQEEDRTFAKIRPVNLRKLPIPKISEPAQLPFISLVDTILAKKKLGENTQTEEDQIDEMVYKLYDLTEEEIAIIEGKK